MRVIARLSTVGVSVRHERGGWLPWAVRRERVHPRRALTVTVTMLTHKGGEQATDSGAIHCL